MSANIAKIAKVTRCMPAELFYIKIDRTRTSVCFVLKTALTNIAKISKVTRIFLAR